MKVIYNGKTDISLTRGKEYEVLRVEKGWYRIVDDTEDDYLFPPEFFDAIERELVPDGV